MENYSRDGMEVLKQDKKVVLLTSKDPSLSHLFDHGGPNTPNSVGADNLSQSAGMDVDAGYQDDPSEHDSYQLFEGHELSSDSSQLMLNSNNHDAYNKLGKAKHSSTMDVTKTSLAEGRQMNVLGGHESGDAAQKHRPGNMVTITLAQSGQTANFINSPPGLTSPPADHYNMQLLAYSAQQQQQQLLQEQQRQQMEHFTMGSSSDALQQLALKAKLRQEQEAQGFTARAQEKHVAYVKTETDQSPEINSAFAACGAPPTAFVQSRKLPSNVSVSASFGGWTVHSAPELIQSQASGKLAPAQDLSFAAQDSPMLPLQDNDETDSGRKIDLRAPAKPCKAPVSIPFRKTRGPPEPELKSPLDHPEHQLDHHQRARFFSGESVSSNPGEEQGDDEAPLNERDKEAAAALRVLLEQSEKASITDGMAKNFSGKSHRDSPALPVPRYAAYNQMAAHSTPPPVYEQTYLAQQNIQQLMRPSSGDHRFAVFQTLPQNVAQVAEKEMSSLVKQEPASPAAMTNAVTQSMVPGAVPLPAGQNMIFPVGSGSATNTSFVIYPVAGQHGTVVRPSNANSSGAAYTVVTTTPSHRGNAYVPVQVSSAYLPEQVVKPKPVSASKPAGRDSRSTSGSSSRRNSDGSLTCGLCGHSFRSTPALNGHMRVHSSSDKKNKEDRHSKTSANDSALKNASIQAHQVLQNSASPSFVEIGRSPPGLLPAGSASAEAVPALLPQQYVTPQPSGQMSNRSHNGLLTMASAASFLKTDTSHPEFVYQPAPMQPTYVVPPTMVLQPAQASSAYPSNVNELKTRMSQQLNYSQIYATPMHPGAFGAISIPSSIQQVPPLIQQDVQYLSEEQAVQAGMDRTAAALANAQSYNTEQQLQDKAYAYPAQEENYPMAFGGHHLETNSLSQLASIAVAAANRDQFPDATMSSEYPPAYPQTNPGHPTPDSGVSDVAWGNPTVNTSSQDVCLTQQDVLYPKANESKTSPIRTGHDPFILPVSTAPRRLQSRYGEYELGPATEQRSASQEQSVTWSDSGLLSSYDDPLMREAVNVASPSKILPNSMMGGTPSCGAMFSSASGRPFRQRHHSEGAHLVKASGSILKQILDSPMSTVKLKQTEGATDENRLNPSLSHPPDAERRKQSKAKKPPNLVVAVAEKIKTEKIASPEKWAEPMPVTRRIRRRRHSADCRLMLKSGSQSAYGLHRQDLPRLPPTGSSPMKKPTTLLRPDARVRRKPPPLVIPSSVNAFTNPVPAHHFYLSNLHHRRRPSGESNSSLNGAADKIPPYTPPPMISPMRSGSGLYCTTPVTPSAKLLFRQLSNDNQNIPTIMEVDESIDDDEELVRSTDPKINIGPRFQAIIPDLKHRSRAAKDRHLADLVWSLPPGGAANNKTFAHLENFMELSCSAAVPLGGWNKEYALDCLFQSNGDILTAVRRLIMRKTKPAPDPKLERHLGVGRLWTQQEVELFQRGMQENRKDFFVISKLVKTRSPAACVERYYHVVKRHRRRVQRPRRFCSDEKPNVMALLAGTPSEVRKAMKIDSAPNSSSSDDEAVNKLPLYAPPGPDLWRQQNESSFSPPRIVHHGSGASPQPLPRPRSQPNAQKMLKTHKDRFQHSNVGNLSPAGSPASTTSVDDQPSRVFTCPVCGKSFGKVKSRNAHMKTHGKQAQEKRRQREEEAARRRGEAPRQINAPHVNLQHANYLVPAATGAPPLLHPGVVRLNNHITM